jgi:hypothetical protein
MKNAASFASIQVNKGHNNICSHGVHGNFLDAIFSFPLPTANIITAKNIKHNPHS